MKYVLATGLYLLASSFAYAVLPVGSTPAVLQLDGENGGKVKGGAWSSQELKGKVHVLFYSSPSEKDTNRPTTDALKKEQFSKDVYASVAVVNMAASWWPDSVISIKLDESQKEFPDTLYVKDVNKMVVDKWHLADNANDVVAFDKDGKVIFSVDGKLTEKQTQELIAAIKSHLGTTLATTAKETTPAVANPNPEKKL